MKRDVAEAHAIRVRNILGVASQIASAHRRAKDPGNTWVADAKKKQVRILAPVLPVIDGRVLAPRARRSIRLARSKKLEAPCNGASEEGEGNADFRSRAPAHWSVV